MHNFVFFAQWRSQEFSCEPNFGGWGVPPVPPGCATVGYARYACRRVCVAVGYNCSSPTALLQTDRVDQRKTCVLHRLRSPNAAGISASCVPCIYDTFDEIHAADNSAPLLWLFADRVSEDGNKFGHVRPSVCFHSYC